MYGQVKTIDFYGKYAREDISTENALIEHIGARNNACEIIGEEGQKIKPIFDFDSNVPINIDEMTVKINKVFPNKKVNYAMREPRLKNEKMRYSVRGYVDGVMIKVCNLAELVKNADIKEADPSIYSRNRKMFLPLTTRKEYNVVVPELKLIGGATLFECCSSYIKEDFEDWDERVEELIKGKKILEVLDKFAKQCGEIVNNDDDVVDAKYVEQKLSLYITKLLPERSTSYDSWSKMIWCLFNICKKEKVSDRVCANIIHSFSKKAINYDESATDDFISKCTDTIREASYGWKYLYDCLKIDDIDYYNSVSTLTYGKMKETFEKTHCKVMFPPMVLYYNGESEYYTGSIKSMKDSYSHLQCKVCIKDKWVNKQFIEMWFKDSAIRVYEKVVFEPPPIVSNPNYFNTWVDFKISKEPLIKTDRDYWQEYLTFAYNLFGDKKVVDYMLARYAYKIQYPAKRTHVIFVITGIEGDGKNRFLQPIYNIMNGYTVELARAKELFEKHSNHEERKLLVLVNEASGSANFENSEVLKTRITENNLTINPKGIQAYKIENMCEYDMTGNGEKIVKISDDSTRRFFQAESTSYYNGNTSFFTDYIENIENTPVALRQIYEGFLNFDWKSIVPSHNFQDPKYKPMTSVMLRVMSSNRDKIIWFLEDWTKKQIFHNPQDFYKVKGKSLYNGFNRWCLTNGVKCEYNSISFGCRFSIVAKKQLNSNGFECVKRDKSNTTTSLCLPELNKYFEKINGCPFENDDENGEDYFEM